MKDGPVTIDTVHACNSGSWKMGSVYYVLTQELASILTGAGWINTGGSFLTVKVNWYT
jgi:hypothetical protein